MANSPQARKRARQSVTRRNRNMSQRSSLRTSIKKFLKLVGEQDRDNAAVAYRDAVSSIDRSVNKGERTQRYARGLGRHRDDVVLD